ncbi:antitoxin VapB family protein [Candidatus Woesearchaeota archaeon]|nr:antitoxin VapB family protein [Candidatus Woesearchaeota archaeon]
MTTKTLTIMEDAYDLLLQNKRKEESFSDVVRRVLSTRQRKRTLQDLFGILSEEEGAKILEDLKKIRRERSSRVLSRVERLYGKSS